MTNAADLATIFRELSRPPNSLHCLPRRIQLCRQALAVLDKERDAASWGPLQITLAQALAQSPQGPRAENLEEAIKCVSEALEIFTREADPQQWAATQHNLAAAYSERICGERTDNIERSIDHYTQALDVFTREAHPEDWALTQMNLTALYQERIRGERAENLDRAIEHGKNALLVYTQQAYPENWAGTLNNLAIAYIERLRGERAENLEQAIEHGKNALRVYTREAYPEDWAMTNHTLANAYRDRIRGDKAKNLEQAIEHLHRALQARTPEAYPDLWALTQNGLGVVYDERVFGGRPENRKCAIDHYKAALTVRTRERSPANFQQTHLNIGIHHFQNNEWGKAIAAYKEAIDTERMLLVAAYTEVGRQAEVAKTSVVYANCAYALLELGRPNEALVQLEQGKTRLLSRALALDELDVSTLPREQRDAIHELRQRIRTLEAKARSLGDAPTRRDDSTLEALEWTRAELNRVIQGVREAHPNFMPDGLEVAEILDLIPEDAALVAPVITSQGSAVFVVPAGIPSLSLDQLLWLPDLKEAYLRVLLQGPGQQAQMRGWLDARLNALTDPSAWLTTIDATGWTLWDRLMGPIAARLATLGIRRVLLMPQGRLGLLPLHAAWRELDGEKRYFLDDYTITYVASAYARRVSEGRLHDTQRHARTLLAVINPTEDLPFTPAEGQQVASLFEAGKSTLLPGSKATLEEVKQAVASYVHFACHGFYNWRDAMQSGVVLAKRKTLSLAQIIGQLNLDATRLVTLSACETGITDIRQSPDEYLGLPAGFLQAGAPAVVSTLWAVNDLSTMLLMERFYQLHLNDGKDLPEALREAQIWLRDVTAGELKKRFADEEEAALAGQGRMPIETASAAYARFRSQDSGRRPFGHPLYWAAFTFSGA